MPTNEDLLKQPARLYFVEYSKAWTGRPYYWGGDDPLQGFDCSGLVVEGLKGIGFLEENDDYAAEGLFNLYKSKEVMAPYAGCLIFWFNTDNKAVHIAIAIDKDFMIHAGGGGRKTTSYAEAIRTNAFIKMRHIPSYNKFRSEKYGQAHRIVDPFLIP